MSKPDSSSGSDRRTTGRPEELSVNRRGFFREILGLGLDQLDQAGKELGKRMGDFVENKRSESPPPLPKLQRPGNTQARE